MVAAPVFAKVAAAYLTQIGIPTEPERAGGDPATRAARAPAPPAAAATRQGDRVLVPDLQGLSVAEVVQRVGGTAIRLELTGRGRAVAQEPVPGTILSAGRERLRVRFEPKDAREPADGRG
jgi:hypothetical protein